MTLEQNPLPGNLHQRVRRIVSPDPRVDIFGWALDDDNALASELAGWLSADERARATRFGSDRLRRRYVVGRGTLRALLGRRLQLAPEAVAITRGRRGRPRLAAASALDFNVSHTEGMMLAAIAEGITVGVDIEHTRREINTQGIARRCLAPAERAVVATLDADAARRDVLQRWTCKEAMSKATGDAMSAPFRRLDVELRHHPVLVAGPPPYLPSDWTLRALAVEGYFATLAVWSGHPNER